MADGARTNRKSDTPASSCVPENSSTTETQKQPGDSLGSSHTKSALRARTEQSHAASQQGQGSKTGSKASATGEESSKGAAPGPADQSLPSEDKAAEGSSINQGVTDGYLKEDKQEKSGGDGGGEDVKTGEDQSAEETKRR